jgi:type I site-specific restriction-modification system R (restriction) subunit
LQVVIEGLFAKRCFLDLVRDFIVFEAEGGGRLVKKMAGYHQFHAVRVAVAETLRAADLVRGALVAEARGRYEAGARPGGRPGDRRIGVVWHTQGSGKSLTMAFYAGRIIHEPAMENPTIVVLTDRNDLDDQLFGTFSRCQDLLRQPPVQAASRAHLRELLSVAAGGVVFTTIHKFFPEEKGDRHPVLSERRNIVVIADEAHRSQYDFIDGFARHMRDALPHASFIGFTGTPVEKTDANTRAVFGDYISVYDIQRAVEDGATVPIYYESRLAKLALDEAERPKIDPDFEEATEGEEVERKVVLVRDMWLTGFDAPSLHTMYLDKPMRGHGLMQAIARVNRVFRDKPGGLVVDYLGLAHELKAALATYTESGGRGRTALDQDEAVAVMREKYEVCCDLFHGFDRTPWTAGTPEERLALLPAAQEHILAQENGKDRYVRAVRELSQAFALAVPHEEALRIRDDVSFFQAVQAVLAKRAPGEARPEEELDHAVRQIISRAVAPEGVLDIFAAAGLQKPDISILSDQFLSEVRGMPQKNLAVELLQKLLNGEIRTRRRKNVVQARSFAEMLERTIRRYQNRAIEAAQVIEELIQLARDMREANARGEALGLSEEELAFYDALETNDSAVKVLGDETLRKIARELVHTVRNNVTIDWTLRENVRAHLRVLVKRILRKYGYPPDKQEKATQTVLEQAEVMSERWAA